MRGRHVRFNIAVGYSVEPSAFSGIDWLRSVSEVNTQMKKQVTAAAIAMAMSIAAVGQSPGGRGAAPAPVGRPPAYPDRPPADPAVLERGKAIYGVQCNFCHGSDARGGEGGPNLLRSELVLNDQKGELIAPIVQNGRGEMPKIGLN